MLTLSGLLVLIIVLCLIRAFVPGQPDPLPLILTIAIIVLAVVFLLVLVQSVGLLPPLFHKPARIR